VRLPLDQPEKLTGSFPDGRLVAFRMSLEPLVVGTPIVAAFAAATSATIIFDSGVGGETEVLWVTYRNRQRAVSRLEAHRLTHQAIVPLTGDIIQVVAGSRQDGSPDQGSMSAFRIPVGQGICMRPGCWHSTRVDTAEVTCLMLTRRSTTVDLIGYLKGGSSLLESAIAAVERAIPAS
jgi:ureidoglycolate lyase